MIDISTSVKPDDNSCMPLKRKKSESTPHADTRRLGLTTAEAAAQIGVHDFTVRRAIWAGELTHFRVGRAVRVRPADLELWVAGLVEAAR